MWMIRRVCVNEDDEREFCLTAKSIEREAKREEKLANLFALRHFLPIFPLDFSPPYIPPSFCWMPITLNYSHKKKHEERERERREAKMIWCINGKTSKPNKHKISFFSLTFRLGEISNNLYCCFCRVIRRAPQLRGERGVSQ